MDTYFRKTRRLAGDLSGSLKRPSISRKLTFDSTASETLVTTPPKIRAEPKESKKQEVISLIDTPTKTPVKPKDTEEVRPTTPTNARLSRPLAPPPVKRKVTPDDVKQVRKRRPMSVKELFHLHDEINHEPNNNNCLGIKPLDIPTSTPPQTPHKQPQPESPSKIESGPLRGVSTSLLDLIRAKEERAKSITPEQIRQRELLGISNELVRIVYTIFTANKKETMLYNTIVDKCCKGLKNNYTTNTITECLDLTLKIAPEWITIVEITRGKFMRLNKTQYSLNQMLKAVQRYKECNSVPNLMQSPIKGTGTPNKHDK